MVNMLKHHCPKLIGHKQFGQAHSDLSIDLSNSFGGQKAEHYKIFLGPLAQSLSFKMGPFLFVKICSKGPKIYFNFSISYHDIMIK